MNISALINKWNSQEARPKNRWLETSFSIDLRTLALFRVCLGLNILYLFISLGMNAREFYSDQGVLPAALFSLQIQHYATSPIFLMNDTVTVTALLLFLGCVAAVAFILGWKTRWATLWMSFFLVSMYIRNPYVVKGGDTLIRYLALWCLFLPLGDKYAWDARPKNPKKTVFGFAAFALIMQVCYVYLFAGYYKMLNIEWLQGRGIICSLQFADTARPFGQWMLQFPGLLVILNYLTLVAEILGPLAFFSPIFHRFFRSFALISLTLLQIGIFLTMEIVNFPAASILASIPLIPGFWWDGLGKFKPCRQAGHFFQKLLIRPAVLGPAPKPHRFEMIFRRALGAVSLYLTIMMCLIQVEDTGLGFKAPKALLAPIRGVMLNQKWSAFSPKNHFHNYNHWYVVSATLKDGSQMDIFRNSAVDWECPMPFEKAYRNPRWALYVRQALCKECQKSDYNQYAYLRFLANEWDRKHAENAVVKAELYHCWKSIRPRSGRIFKERLFTYSPQRT